MSLTVLILLTIVAAVVVAALILGEIFFLPGFGLPGILGCLGLVGISGYLFLSGYGTLGMIFIVIVAVLFALGFWTLALCKQNRDLHDERSPLLPISSVSYR